MARHLVLPLILVVALAGLVIYVGGEERVTLELLGKAYEMKLQIAIPVLVTGIAAIIAFWSFCVWLWKLPQRVKAGFVRKRETGGLAAVEDALMLCEAGDSEQARKRAARAHELLQRPTLTAFVSAKAAESAGNLEDAVTYYTSLLDDSKAEVAGLRGLARIADQNGDFTSVIKMARSAYAPDAGTSVKGRKWAFDLLLRALLNENDWCGAMKVLGVAEKRKHIEKDVARRMRAVLLSAEATRLDRAGDRTRAQTTIEQALEASCGFVPGAVLGASLFKADGQKKKAASILEKAWVKAPHPALSLAYRDLFSDESEKTRSKKMLKLVNFNNGHRESTILKAEEALLARDAAGALQALSRLLSDEDPSARLCMMAARAETLLGNAIDARTWELRAATAPVEAGWSALDPDDGPTFAYTEQDWRQLVRSYSENGELIYPHYKVHLCRRDVIEHAYADTTVSNATTSLSTDEDIVGPPLQPDDPGIPDTTGEESGLNRKKKTLAERFESLLDKLGGTNLQ